MEIGISANLLAWNQLSHSAGLFLTPIQFRFIKWAENENEADNVITSFVIKKDEFYRKPTIWHLLFHL